MKGIKTIIKYRVDDGKKENKKQYQIVSLTSLTKK
jgi:hypothetical protein